MKAILLLTLLSYPSHFLLEGTTFHAIYLSVVEIDHSQLNETAEIRIKVFANDMEDAFRNEFGDQINFSNPASCSSQKGKIESYFQKHFSCSIDGKKASLSLKQCEPNGDAIWFHFQSPCAKTWNLLEVKADYLMELFPTQSNVVSVYNGDDKRFVNLTKSNSSQQIKF